MPSGPLFRLFNSRNSCEWLWSPIFNFGAFLIQLGFEERRTIGDGVADVTGGRLSSSTTRGSRVGTERSGNVEGWVQQDIEHALPTGVD